MSDNSLVVKEASIEDLETTLKTAAGDLRTFFTDLMDDVDQITAGWSAETGSKQAADRAARRMIDASGRAAAVLETMATAVHNYGEEAHDIEVKNVAIVG